MDRLSPQDTNHRLALILSLGLHALLLISVYHLSLKQPGTTSSGYSIELSTALGPTMPAPFSPPSDQPAEQPPAKTQQAAQLAPAEATPPPPPKDTVPALQDGPGQDTTQEQVQAASQDTPEATMQPSPEEPPETLDERGLYKASSGKQAGASLELAGWTWNAVPQPQDDTEESGTIVFEIKIDDLGEVIAVKTLDKTVSPLVEKIYKEALIKLTFSRTTDNTGYAPTTTGKVTFILRAQ
ncbi:MAG: hypothetical protein ROO73_06150 [Roseivirga sp.]